MGNITFEVPTLISSHLAGTFVVFPLGCKPGKSLLKQL